ncbi:MAG TPA: DNA gyrase subunit A, partial [Acidimicrobiales bacterium]|nr:DNA gyrase subunit A [Acidimicrobiales bacterium]
HPHGDSAIYEALVRMGQIWSLRHPLIDPHGNFGSPNDGAAAMRYTESRLSSLAMKMMEGIDEETVDFLDNFDGSSQEPKVLPARFPNLLVNGGQGIAVGMATNIPPHNLQEVADAAIHLINNPDATIKDLMEYIKGPDFPTGGEILGHSGIYQAYMTGRGSIKVRAKAEIVEGGKYDQIVVTEIPYQTSVETIEEKAAALVDRKDLEGIRLIRNESAKGKTRLVFELKKDAPALVILNQLYKGTPLQTSFPVNMVALDDGVPRTMTLLDALTCWVKHQIEIVTRRTEYRLEKAEHELHINTGLLKAIGMIDEIIATIRASEDRATAREALMAEPFEFSEIQTNHILDMQLGRLTRLGRDQIEEKVSELTAAILELQAILADDKILRNIIIDELTEIRDEFSNERRTKLVADPGDFLIEDLIEDEDLVFSLSAGGYVKTVSSDEFRSQGRGGRGVAGAALKDEDLITTILHTSAHAYLLFFTNLGKVYRLKAHQIPTMGRTARGTAIVNLLQLSPEEKVAAVIDTRDYETNRFLVFATRKGQIKKTKFTEYDKSRSKGLIAINLKEDDELVRVIPTTGEDDICLVSSNGKVMRFHEKEARPMGRSAGGVRGIKLKAEDEVVAVSIAREAKTLLIVTDKGFGKRTEMENFNPKHRAGQGVVGIKLSEDRGKVVASRAVGDDDEVFMISSNGVIIRMQVSSISVQGRSATGVKLMAVEDGVQVTAIAPVIQEGELEETSLDS